MKSYQKKNLALKFVCFSLIFMLLGLGVIFCPQSIEIANAENFISHTVDNGKFSMKITANTRTPNPLDFTQKTVQTVVGEEISYLCFNWRDLESLNFKFTSNIKGSRTAYQSFKFVLTNLQTDDLTLSVGVNDPEILYQGTIINNNFSQFNFQYYIDKDAKINETQTKCKGNDFGLYKFDFIYSYIEESNEISVSIGDVYIAILPDDIDSISISDTKILYSVASSNRLMNIFNLYLSDNTYKYVNPKYLQWNVVGIDQLNTNYVLTQKAKDSNINYSNHKTIWQSLDNTNGTNFVFDSNNIEGTWTATCTIFNSDGSEKLNLSVSNLSTIKKEQKSYWWLILLIILICLLVGGTVALIVFRKKRDKIW